MGCSPSILSSLSNNNNNNRKDSGLYCSNNNSDNISNKIDAHNDTNTSTALANQILVQSSTKDALEKVSESVLVEMIFIQLDEDFISLMSVIIENIICIGKDSIS